MNNIQPNKIFIAIVKSTENITVEITENEYKVIQEFRRLSDKGKHHQMMIGQRDGKYLIYHINLHTRF